MTSLRRPLVLALVALVPLGAAGCGAEDIARDSPAVKEAIRQCRERAKDINDPNARRAALDACGAAEGGDASGAKDSARRQCLEAARRAPDAAARREAEAACRNIR